jgi:hypothetical protein
VFDRNSACSFCAPIRVTGTMSFVTSGPIKTWEVASLLGGSRLGSAVRMNFVGRGGPKNAHPPSNRNDKRRGSIVAAAHIRVS